MAYILDTTHTTIVYPDTPLIEPDIIHTIMGEKDYVLEADYILDTLKKQAE